MKQKHFMDIENLREEDTGLRRGNGHGFEPGDIISITEKYDGSCACAAWDDETEQMFAFSRKQTLSYNNTLNGFWNYVQNLSEDTIEEFKNHPSWRIFGEWSNRNKIVYYDTNKKKHWYVFDIYDSEAEIWLHQDFVKVFCERAGLEYIHELYFGPFISWEHCKSFLHSPAYGDRQEGIVVKNESKLNNPDSRLPFYLKIVNEDFKESMKRAEKIIDPAVESAKAEAQAITDSIITKNRVEKMLFKLRDEGVLSEKISPSDMKLVARELPKRIYEDCVKEEKELVIQCGEYFGKMCGIATMKIAREIILGK